MDRLYVVSSLLEVDTDKVVHPEFRKDIQSGFICNCFIQEGYHPSWAKEFSLNMLDLSLNTEATYEYDNRADMESDLNLIAQDRSYSGRVELFCEG